MASKYRENAAYTGMMRRMLRAYTVRVVEAADPQDLADLARFVDDVEAALTDAVHQLRAEKDYSWAQIGKALGITRTAAQKRFGGEGSRQVGGQPTHLR